MMIIMTIAVMVIYSGECEKITVEIKCPFPDPLKSNNALQIAKILCNAGFDAHEGYIK